MTQTGPSPFRAILWKELRENLKWALLGCALIAVTLFIGIEAAVKSPAAVDAGMIIIDAFSMKYVFTALIGFGMGLAQSIPENRGDRWGLMVHRPLSRSRLFWGKITVGTSLYTLAVGFPLCIAALWARQPGHVPIPFDWRLTLPAVADVLCGLVYYFAGLLTGMREARFSRPLGIGIGVVCSVLAVSVQTFWQAAACCAVGIVVAGTAARGSFIGGGQYEPLPRSSRAATALVVGSGLAVIGIFFVMIASDVLRSPAVATTRPLEYALTNDGTVVQVDRDRLWDSTLEVRDLQGRPIEKYNDPSARERFGAGVLWASTSFSPDGRRSAQFPSTAGYRTVSAIFTQLPPPTNEVRWYYLHDRGLAVEYDGNTLRITGWLGPDGFTAGEEPPAKHFNAPLQSISPLGPLLFAFEDSVYRLDLTRRTSKKVFTAPADESILGAGGRFNSYRLIPVFAKSGSFDVVATSKRIYIQDPQGKSLLTVPYDPLAAGYGELQVARLSDAPDSPTFVWYFAESGSFQIMESLAMPIQVTQYNSDGSIASHLTLPRPLFKVPVQTAGIAASSLVMPVAARTAIEFKQWFTGNRILLGSVTPDTVVPGWALSIAVSLVASLAAFQRGIRYAFAPGRLWLWAVLVFALGPLGYVLMRILIPWPAKEDCPSCKRQRVVTRENCEHCNATFPGPAEDGTEIFEAVTT